MTRLKKICFFITPIGKPDSSERRRADQVQKYILTEVLGPKYKIVRADELPHPGSITHQIIRLLYDADLVVADLTGSNANVAYELAIRHAFNKVSIHLIDKADTIPFDLKDERTIVFDLNDLDSIKSCKEELKKFASVILNGNLEYSSLVFCTLGVAAATAEEKQGFLEKVADQIDSIATDISAIDTTITLSDIDSIDSIKDTVEALEKQNIAAAQRLDSTERLLRQILKKFGDNE
jgi:hypothetical protein